MYHLDGYFGIFLTKNSEKCTHTSSIEEIGDSNSVDFNACCILLAVGR